MCTSRGLKFPSNMISISSGCFGSQGHHAAALWSCCPHHSCWSPGEDSLPCSQWLDRDLHRSRWGQHCAELLPMLVLNSILTTLQKSPLQAQQRNMPRQQGLFYLSAWTIHTPRSSPGEALQCFPLFSWQQSNQRRLIVHQGRGLFHTWFFFFQKNRK